MLGLIAAGSGFGGSLFSLVIGNWIATHGFQSAYLLTAILLAISALPIIVFIRSKPEATEPANNKLDPDSEIAQKNTPSKRLNYEFLKQPYILLTLLCVFLIGMCIGSVIQNTAPYLDEKGFDTVFAAGIASAIFFIQALSKISLGIFSDKLGIKKSLSISLVCFLIATTLLIFLTKPWMAWIYVFFAGVAMSSFAVLIPLYINTVLEQEHFEQYVGLFMAVSTGASGLGNPIINFTFDLTRTYTYIFAVYAFIGAIALVMVSVSLRMKSNQKCCSPLRKTDELSKEIA